MFFKSKKIKELEANHEALRLATESTFALVGKDMDNRLDGRKYAECVECGHLVNKSHTTAKDVVEFDWTKINTKHVVAKYTCFTCTGIIGSRKAMLESVSKMKKKAVTKKK